MKQLMPKSNERIVSWANIVAIKKEHQKHKMQHNNNNNNISENKQNTIWNENGIKRESERERTREQARKKAHGEKLVYEKCFIFMLECVLFFCLVFCDAFFICVLCVFVVSIMYSWSCCRRCILWDNRWNDQWDLV